MNACYTRALVPYASDVHWLIYFGGMYRQYRYYRSVGCGVCGVFCLYAEESWWRDYSGEEARLKCMREGRLGVDFGLVGLVNGSWTDVYYSEDMKADGLQCFL